MNNRREKAREIWIEKCSTYVERSHYCYNSPDVEQAHDNETWIVNKTVRYSAVACLTIFDDEAVLAFRGTSTLHDWISNLMFWTSREGNHGRVHRGFQRALDAIWYDIEDRLHQLPDLPLAFVGHSLGGALATICASRKPPNILSTFGAPRVGNEEFKNSIAGDTWFCMINTNDPVPLLPPVNFLGLGYVDGGRIIFLDYENMFREYDSSADIPKDVLQYILRPFRNARKIYGIDKALEPGRLIVKDGLPTSLVPPSAGFTRHFEELHERPFSENVFVIPWLKDNIYDLPPPYLYELARRVFQTDPEEACVWFWLGSIRCRYDAYRCVDKTAGQGILYWPRSRRPSVSSSVNTTTLRPKRGSLRWTRRRTFPRKRPRNGFAATESIRSFRHRRGNVKMTGL